MKKYLIFLGILILLIGIYYLNSSHKLGAAITVIQGTDTLTASRSVINTNFANLNAGSFDFTPTSVFGLTTSGTSTAIFSTLGFYASSTSIFSTTTVMGALNIGTLTATSGTSYINALNLGTALTVANGGTGATSITGLVLGAGTSAMGAYAGTSCTNQFPRSLNASGAATCASVALIADTTGTLTVARGGTGSIVFSNNSLIYYDGTNIISTSTQPLYIGQLTATTTNATSTFFGGLTATGTLMIPFSSTPTVSVGGVLEINTNTASTSLLFHDGTAQRGNYTDVPKSFFLSTSTIAYMGGTATATMKAIYPFASTITRITCATSSTAGTFDIQFGDGSASTTALHAGSALADSGMTPTNGVFNMFEPIFIGIGKLTSNPEIVCTYLLRRDN